MAHAPAISVIMPVYNGEKYLKEAVDSVLGQTFGDFELLIVDDGSTDNTSAILENLRNEPKIRVLRQANQGVSAARNRAILEAQGAYIGFLDADDVFFKDSLAFAMAQFKASPTLEVLYAGHPQYCDEHLHAFSRQSLLLTPTNTAEFSQYAAETLLSSKICSNLQSYFIKRQALGCESLFDTALVIAEDYDFLYRQMTRLKTGIILNRYNFQYRKNQNSAMHSVQTVEKRCQGTELVIQTILQHQSSQADFEHNKTYYASKKWIDLISNLLHAGQLKRSYHLLKQFRLDSRFSPNGLFTTMIKLYVRLCLAYFKEAMM